MGHGPFESQSKCGPMKYASSGVSLVLVRDRGAPKLLRKWVFGAIYVGNASFRQRDLGMGPVLWGRGGGGRWHGILVGGHPWVKYVHIGLGPWT